MTETHFLNIDLDLESTQPIDELVNILGKSFTKMTYHKCENLWRASFETAESDIESIIDVFFHSITLLAGEPRIQWDNCSKREFNLGFQAENSPRSFVKTISDSSLSKITEIGGTLGVTIYAPERNFT
jgi:hypothetical protein